MPRNQEGTGSSGRAVGRVPAQIYLDPADWERLDVVAQAQNRSRSAQVRELIRREIERFDDRLEQAA